MRQSLQEMKDSGFRVFVVILITNEDEFVRELQTLGMYGKGYTYGLHCLHPHLLCSILCALGCTS